MKSWNNHVVPGLLAIVVLVTGTTLWAQSNERPNRERGERGDRGRQVDRDQMRERMEQRREAMSERMREALGVSEAEWSVLEPMIDDIRALQAEGNMGGRGMMMMAGRAGRAGDRGDRAGRGQGMRDRDLSPLAQARFDLARMVRDENAGDTDIQAQLETLHAARAEHEAKLSAARDELREVVTPRQEAVLTMAGVL